MRGPVNGYFIHFIGQTEFVLLRYFSYIKNLEKIFTVLLHYRVRLLPELFVLLFYNINILLHIM
jgi:hypothetical protein